MSSITENNSIIIEAVAKAVATGSHFYAYRMPGEQELHFGAQIIDQHTPMGFYIRPFRESPDSPTTYISAQFDAAKFLRLPTSTLTQRSTHNVSNIGTLKEQYMEQAHNLIARMCSGELRKVVLSRTICGKCNGVDWANVFSLLTASNPNAFVFIFNTETTGTWLGASPECYLSYSARKISTMALAGTRSAGAEGNWGDKEIEEQRIVADYIEDLFTNLNIKHTKSDTYSRQAGNVEHLCTDFTGEISNMSQVDKMQNMLHPTPALAGLPTKDALKLIGATEKHRRRYYGGYIGPIDFRGNFNYFVNLRSVEFDKENYCLYAGGGLTADSVAEDEWLETEQKSQLLLNLISNSCNHQ